MDLNGFDAESVEPRSAFEAIPAGEYEAIIAESEEKPTKAGNGHYLQLVVQIVDGEHKGRKLWARLNLDNPNQQAVDIARAELSAICRAIGVITPKASSDLHDKPLLVKVTVKKSDYSGEFENEIKAWKPLNPDASAIGGAPPKAAAAGGKPAWMKK
jgi:hypothetical protein